MVTKCKYSPLTNHKLSLSGLSDVSVDLLLWEGESGNKRIERGDGGASPRLLKFSSLCGNKREVEHIFLTTQNGQELDFAAAWTEGLDKI